MAAKRPRNVSQRIPNALHIIWIGDESRRPEENIESWRRHNPALTVTVWGNRELQARPWRNARHMTELWSRELNGVADLMRYEILFEQGGIAVDADSRCLRPLDDFLFDHDPFASWESETARPGLISCAFMGACSGNELIGTIIEDIAKEKTLLDRMAWRSTGPLRLTECAKRTGYPDLTIFPSHYFNPNHFTGLRYDGPGPVYCDHQWGSTQELLRKKSVSRENEV